MNTIEELFENMAKDGIDPPPVLESLDDAIGFLNYIGRRMVLTLEEVNEAGGAWQDEKSIPEEFIHTIATLATLIAVVVYRYMQAQEQETRH